MKNDFILAFNEVIEDKQLPKEVILKALESAMVSAYRKSVNASNAQHVEATVDSETGKVTIYAEKEIVESVQDERTEVDLETAQKIDPEAVLGGMVVVESTPKNFGRVAAQTARQVIQQRIRDAERQAQLDYYSKQVGEIVSGIVQAANSQGLTVGLELRAEGNLARKDMIPGERFRIHDRVRTLVAEVNDTPRGPQIVLSRTHRDFLRRLLENEVPEIYHGIVEVRSIAREPGERAKVAVSATQSGIDPVGACVGIRGVRIQAIVRELHDEKIDVIEWNPDPIGFIAKAISPARVTGVYLSDNVDSNKTATVVVPEDQLSLAIGRDGQNARLAAKLTGWRIDIKSLSEAAGDAVHKIQTEETLAEMAEKEGETVEKVSVMLAKKAEGRPLTPEEYDTMARFVDRVEKRISIKTESLVVKETDEQKQILESILPQELIEQNLLDSLLPEHVVNILQEVGFVTVGDLVYQMRVNPDEIFKLQGIGPRAMKAIETFMEELFPETEEDIPAETVEIEEVPVEESVVEEIAAETEKAMETVVKDLSTPVEEAVEEAVEEEVEAEQSEETKEELFVEDIETETEEDDEEEEVPVTEEEEASFEELFKLKAETIQPEDFEGDSEDDEFSLQKSGKKKKKKKKRFAEIEYDPEEDFTHVRRKHKHGDEEWDWE